jgi:hypothetical protein
MRKRHTLSSLIKTLKMRFSLAAMTVALSVALLLFPAMAVHSPAYAAGAAR